MARGAQTPTEHLPSRVFPEPVSTAGRQATSVGSVGSLQSVLSVLSVVSVLSVLGFGFSASASAAEIAFDRGGDQLTTVIGWYSPERARYILGGDFTIQSVESLTRVTVRIHAHVGDKIKPLDGETEPRVAVRVNGGAWYWKSLEPWRNDRDQWILIDIPVSEWKTGLNRLEVNSNIANPGNRTPETLDLLGCAAKPIAGRSHYSLDDGRTVIMKNDRNWGIRLQIEERASAGGGAPARLELQTPAAPLRVNEPAQFLVRAVDAGGKTVAATGARWTATGGTIDDFGLFRPDRSGNIKVSVRLGDLHAEHAGVVTQVIPFGIEPPDSPKRMAFVPPEGHVTLSGRWDFRLDPENKGEREEWFRPGATVEWGDIAVPGTWQAQGYGIDYHGVGWYRRTLKAPDEWAGKRLWVEFHGVSTKATVWLNGRKIGEHMGNWAPFTVSLEAAWESDNANILAVRVEELPNHFSAGFPKEIGRLGAKDSHFGGLWQDVTLFATGDARLDDVFVLPRLAAKKAELRIALRSGGAKSARVLCSVVDTDGKVVASRDERVDLAARGGDRKTWGAPTKLTVSLAIPEPRLWSPDSPHLYTAKVEVHGETGFSDRQSVRFGMRSVERKGTQILLNGEPLMVRGVLHWGYYPDLFNIDPAEETIRKEFQDLRGSGFNLVKVCLFVFPRCFYDIADETGMLLWQEYPTWLYIHFPQAGDNRLDADFLREYPEWFRFDRSRASIVLRDLTCEAHINPNWDLLERVYRIGKEMTGDAMLCDNSSFFTHRITDWYVCHTYRDLDDYYSYFATLAGEMRAKPEAKPFLFGEDFDADTFRDSEAIRERHMSEGTPWWLDNENFRGQLRCDETLRQDFGPKAPRRLVDMQLRHAFALRKAYIEEFRRYPEPAGFVMTSIRDITATRPGFYDDCLEPKWTPAEWKRFNADRVLVLYAERRSRCFRADEPIRADLIFSNYGDDLANAPLRWRLLDGKDELARGEAEIAIRRGEIQTVGEIKITLTGSQAETDAPFTCRLVAEIGAGDDAVRNEWPVWIFPADKNVAAAKGIRFFFYSPNGAEKLAAAYPGIDLAPVQPDGNGSWTDGKTGEAVDFRCAKDAVLLTDVLDDAARAAVSGGARAIFLPGSDSVAPYKRLEAPFWRETAIWLPEGDGAKDGVLGDFPNDGFVDLQFLDMTTRKPFALGELRTNTRPLVWGINGRNPGNGPYDYVFETQMDRGRVVACCLNLGGETNVAGRHFLRCLARHALRELPETNASDAAPAAARN